MDTKYDINPRLLGQEEKYETDKRRSIKVH